MLKDLCLGALVALAVGVAVSAEPPAEGSAKQVAREGDARPFRAHFTRTRPADAPEPTTIDERNREQLGRLEFSLVTASCEGMPLREALRALRKELGINLVAFYLGNTVAEVRGGVDPDLPITLSAQDESGRAVLETIAAACGPEVTWQLVNGTVEFGPRAVLARPTARRVMVLDTRDLAHDMDAKWENRGIGATRVEPRHRNSSDKEMGLLMGQIAARCEPEAFQPAPPTMIEDAEGKLVPLKHATPGASGNNRCLHHARNLDPDAGPIFIRGKWAAMQARDNLLTITGPSFVLRAIEGPGEPIPPKEAR